MTKDELVKTVVENTVALKNLKEQVVLGQDAQRILLNDHLHSHLKLRFWLFTFLITSNLSFFTIIIYLLTMGTKMRGL